MKTSETISKVAPALLKAQRKMGSATKGAANPFFRSKYADLGAVMEVVKDPLNEEGITILQPAYSKEGSHYVETVLMHESGEYIASEPLKLELSKTDMQSLGSAITYSRRYTLQSLLSIPAEDDDGEGAMNRQKTSARSEKKVESAPLSAQEEKDAKELAKQDSALTMPTNIVSVSGPTIQTEVPNTVTTASSPKSYTSFRNQKKQEQVAAKPDTSTAKLNF